MTTDEQDLKLSLQDVQRLKDNPSPDVRIAMVSKLAEQYKNMNLSDKEQQIAQDIFKIALSDPDISVRKSLSFHLKDANFLPEDIVQRIIDDQTEVSCPFIQATSLLSETTLLSLIQHKDEATQTAIATRTNTSARISEALIENSSISTILALLYNETAQFSDYAYQRLIERFKDENVIHQALMTRRQIPGYVLEKLVGMLSDDAKKQLLTRHDLSEPLVITIVSQIREKSMLSLDQSSTEEDVRSLVIQLNNMEQLSPNLILRTACMGDMKFFEYAIATCAGVPIRNARILIHDSGSMGLERLYEEAKLPIELYPAISLAVKTYQEMMNETEYGYRDHFCRRLIERLLISFEEKQIQINSYDMDYFLHKVGKQSGQKLLDADI